MNNTTINVTEMSFGRQRIVLYPDVFLQHNFGKCKFCEKLYKKEMLEEHQERCGERKEEEE